MKKLTVLITTSITFLFLTLTIAAASGQSSYSENRSRIENLIARYTFALDFKDADAYASTFSENGILDSGIGIKKGREEIKSVIALMNGFNGNAEVRRHIISNIVLKIEGDKAVGRAYWHSVKMDKVSGAPAFISFGHYEDEYVKVNGEWFFSKRKIYNEKRPNRSAKGPNPAW